MYPNTHVGDRETEPANHKGLAGPDFAAGLHRIGEDGDEGEPQRLA